MGVNQIAGLVPVEGGYAWAPPLSVIQGLTCADPGQDPRPAKEGDFLSYQPDGSWQTRTHPASWETLTIQGPYFAYLQPVSGRLALVLPPGL